MRGILFCRCNVYGIEGTINETVEQGVQANYRHLRVGEPDKEYTDGRN